MIVTLTLSEGSLPGLGTALTELGLEVRNRPLLSFASHTSAAQHSALRALASDQRFEAIVLTSPRAATVLRSRVAELGPADASRLPPVWAAARQTQCVLLGSLECRVPERGTGAVPLADAMLTAGIRGPVLYLCSPDRRSELPERLKANGVEVTELHAYDVELAGPSVVREALRGTDLVLIASHRVLHAAAEVALPSERPGLICLGPATASTALELGWKPSAVAAEPTVTGVIDAVHSLLFAVPGPQSSPSNPSSGR